ncbi:hypothetical protein [Methanoculleus chikugoensis]|uniref:hypothetical protein n=1 Tax=Methanoculleus chikugoensis TaxID=118126 RepID=UPI0006D28EDC|nr:hypothetical protein [Methanoculleus chikugoensis]
MVPRKLAGSGGSLGFPAAGFRAVRTLRHRRRPTLPLKAGAMVAFRGHGSPPDIAPDGARAPDVPSIAIAMTGLGPRGRGRGDAGEELWGGDILPGEIPEKDRQLTRSLNH